jgi:hypothetical protein
MRGGPGTLMASLPLWRRTHGTCYYEDSVAGCYCALLEMLCSVNCTSIASVNCTAQISSLALKHVQLRYLLLAHKSSPYCPIHQNVHFRSSIHYVSFYDQSFSMVCYILNKYLLFMPTLWCVSRNSQGRLGIFCPVSWF